MALVFLPARREFFLWGEQRNARGLEGLVAHGRRARAEIVAPGRRAEVAGIALPLLDTIARLATVPAADIPTLPASIATWTLASKLALDLVSRERVVPAVVGPAGDLHARWRAALSAAEDLAQLAALARSLPPSAHAAPAPGHKGRRVWAPEALLRAFLDATVDALVWASATPLPAAPRPGKRRASDDHYLPWERRWLSALSAGDSRLETEGFAERNLAEDLDGWIRPALGADDRLRVCFRLELPAADRNAFKLRFLLQPPDDPSLLVTAAEVWRTKGRSLVRLGQAFRDPQKSLLAGLGRAARLFAPLADTLVEARPEALALDPAMAWQFLSEGAPTLAGAGFGVIVPGDLTAAGQRRLRLRMKVGAGRKVAGAVAGTAGLGVDELLSFEWEATLGDATLSARDFKALARHKAPLVRYRGEWVAVDPRELAEINRRLSNGSGKVRTRQALVSALAGETRHDGVSVAVSATGAFADFLTRLRESAGAPGEPPATFHGELRPYQARGLAWLSTLGTLGLGACLADDMGLGKTIQLLAFLLWRLETAPTDKRPALLIAPTSVLGNWERETARFAPSLTVVRHYGAGRVRKSKDIPRKPGTLVLTSYGLLRRDIGLLSAIDWSAAVLDEAQNIKNAASATARAARSLKAAYRFALTGTPVENRLAELWSIFEFANPGLLGPLETFRREYAVPIERYGNDDAAERLRKVVSPFLLRRLKSDPTVIRDLPAKHEMKVICTLTREQATLYQAVVDEELRRIESADGIERRGRVLALLMFLKQICNHPAQYLGETEPLPGRSGKLARVAEMLEEAVAAGDKALVFTQFREMGDRLVAYLAHRLGVEVAFLHGGTPRKARDDMIRRFQDEPYGPRVFVLSVKAGGTGLNLTAASHVFHFDRWWNPAVEDQATDRAHRIGQTRAVQVHKLICAGTVEEKVDRLLEQKRKLASSVISSGEKWITELGNDELRELFSLAADATVDAEEPDAVPRRRRGRRAEARA
ncbi:DEAD/DEAH box helicase [soil metagenome]